MNLCAGCEAPILWAITDWKGARMPVDADDEGNGLHVSGGNLVPTGEWVPSDGGSVPVVRVALAGERTLFDMPGEVRWRSHFATCPKAQTFRRRS